MRKRGETWELRAGGVSRSFRGSERQAQSALARLVIEVEERRAVPSHGRTVAMLAAEWLEVMSPNCTPKVASDNRRWLERECLPALGGVPLGKLSVHHIDKFYATLRRHGNSPATIARKSHILSPMLEQGVRWGWLGTNPARRATKPVVIPTKVVPPEPARVAQLLRFLHSQDSAMFTFTLLAADTGARRGQLLALQHYDFNASEATVSFTKTKGDRGDVRKLSATKGRIRTVPLGAETVRTLSAHLTKANEWALAFGRRLGKEAFIFSDDPMCRSSWPTSTFQTRYKRLRDRAGIHEVNFHQLRHYVATQLIGAGVDVRTVADRLGHSRTSTTLDMYAAPIPETGRKAAQLLEQLLRDATNRT